MNERVGILFEALGAEGVLKDAKNIDQALNRLRHKDLRINLDGGAKSLGAQSNVLRSRIQQINGALKKLSGRKGIDTRINILKGERNRLQADLNKLGASLRLTPQVDLKAAFRRGRSAGNNVGRWLETSGNALKKVAYNPLSQVFTGTLRQFGVGISGLMREGFSSSIERFDTMRTYPKLMSKLGFSTKESQASIDKLNKAVLGLPTSLSDITKAANTYASSMGDIQKGTDLAIAANNAFLASSSNELQKRQGEIQLKNIIAGKKLTSKQWQSLYGAMPVAMAQIGKDMGYKTTDAFQKELYAGQISNKDLINAMIKSGTGKGALVDMANVSKSTMAGVITNIKTAFSRMGAGLLDVLDTAFTRATGKSFVGNLSGVIDQIDGMTAKMKNWVKANPDKIKKWIDTIKSIDFSGFIGGFVKGVTGILKPIGAITKLISQMGGLEKVGKGLGRLTWFAPVLTFGGQLTKGLSWIPGLVNVGREARGLERVGLFGHLTKFFGGLKKVDKATDGVKPMSTANKVGKISSGLTLAKANFMKVAMVAGEIAMMAGAATAVVGSILGMAKMVQALGKINIDWSSAAPKLIGFGSFIAAFGVVASKIAGAGLRASFKPIMEAIGIIGAIVTSISGLVFINTWLFKKSAQNLKVMTESVGDAIEGIKRIQQASTGFTWNSGALENLQTAMSEINKLSYKGEGGRYGHADKKFSESLKIVVDNFTKTIDQFVKLSETIGKVKEIDGKAVGHVNAIKKQMSEFYNALDDDTTFKLGATDGGKVDKKNTANFSEMVSDYQSTLDSISSIVTTFTDMQKNLTKLAVRRKGGGSQLGDLKGYVESLIASLGGIFDAFEENFKNTEYSTWKKTGEMGEQVSNMQNAMTSIQSIVQTFVDMQKNLTTLFKGKEGEGKGDVITGYVKELITNMGTIFTEFNKAFGTDVFTSGDIEAMQKKVTSMQTAMTAIQGIAQTYLDMQKNLSKLGENTGGYRQGGIGSKFMQGAGIQQTAQAGITGGITGLITQLRTVADQLNTLPEITDPSAKLQAIGKSLGEVQKITKTLTKMEKAFAEKDFEGVVTKIRNFLNQLSTLGTATGGLGGNAVGTITSVGGQLNMLATALERLKAAVQGFSLEGIAGLGTAFASIGKHIDTLIGKINKLSSRFKGSGSKWARAIITGFNSVNVGGKINSKLKSAFRARSYWSNGFSTGLSFGQGLQAGIDAINIDTSGLRAKINGVLGIVGAANFAVRAAQNQQKGGMIYASKGQLIGFKPKGTDTVPAMLTPGEFVQRKAAVNHFGSKFMERINALDLPGALNSLSFRAAKLATPNGAPVIINNTRNNNAQVIQHNNVRHTGTALKHANRWVNKL